MTESTDRKTTFTQAELVDMAKARFGADPMRWAFVCPNCGEEATPADFKAAGGDPNRIGQECIGRSCGALSGGPTQDSGRSKAARGCDWTAYGLFGGPWTVVLPAEDDRPERTTYSFALAEVSA